MNNANEHVIDVLTWFSQREIQVKPKHFVMAKTPLTSKSKQWIADKLKGRYVLVNKLVNDELSNGYLINAMSTYTFPAFEDPHEAIFYELTWS